MKKVILTAVAALAFSASSFAQSATAPVAAPTKAKMTKAKTMEAPAQGTPAAPAQGAPSMEKGKSRAEGAAKGGMNALGLSADQETKFKAINQAHKAAVQAVQSNAALAADAKKAQVAALVSKYQSDVQGVMNADQFANWTAMRAKRDARKDNDSDRKEGDHKGGDHKKGDHKADGAMTPADGTMTPAAAPAMKQKKAPKAN